MKPENHCSKVLFGFLGPRHGTAIHMTVSHGGLSGLTDGASNFRLEYSVDQVGRLFGPL